MTVTPNNFHNDQQQTVDEVFTGVLTLMPKMTRQRAKIRASFIQKVLREGVLSICPAISFHAIVPNDSPVFEIVKRGDVQSLRKLLDQGSASLTDCDTDGHSLLWVLNINIHSFDYNTN